MQYRDKFLFSFACRLQKWVVRGTLFFLLGGMMPLQASTEMDFDRWMGSQTKHWSYIKQEKDRAELDKYRLLFKKNAKLVESAQGTVKIPKTVHFIWLGPRSFPPKSVSNVRSWIAKNPDWKFKFWTDRSRDPPCHGMETILIKEYPFSMLKQCYLKSSNWGEKSDILRFEILYDEGGVYVDHDASCLQPFTPYHQAYHFFCGLETPHPPFVGRNITAGNGLIGSCPGHPVIKSVIDLIHQRWDIIAEKFAKDLTLSAEQIVMERTYIALTDALTLSLDQPGYTNIVFPAAYFFAKKGIQPILSKHFFANSWADEKPESNQFEKNIQREVKKIENRFNQLALLHFATLAINLVLIGFGLFSLTSNSKRSQCK